MKIWNKRQWLFTAAICLILITIWVVRGNTQIELTEYIVTSSKVPESFTCFEIAQISDLHNAELGEENSKLLELLSEVEPHIIVLTGDLIDSRQTDIEIALDFAGKAAQIAPVYYVSGNHEARVPVYEELKMGLTEAGVTVLENQKVQVTRDGESITLMGIQDPSFRTDYLFGDAESVSRLALSALQNESDGFTVLLSHRPELFDV